MSEPFVSSRFFLRDRCEVYPYFDIHNQDTNGPVFDLGVDMDSYDGALYVRPEYVIDMARTLGMATVEEVAEMRATIAELTRKINKLPAAQEELKSGLDSVVAGFYTALANVDLPDDSPIPSDKESEPVDIRTEEIDSEADRPLVL